jgi:hypothetical protein
VGVEKRVDFFCKKNKQKKTPKTQEKLFITQQLKTKWIWSCSSSAMLFKLEVGYVVHIIDIDH